MQARKNKFAVFFDPLKTTSGQRFFSGLTSVLHEMGACPVKKANVVLFNVSAPVKEILKARLRGQEVVLRLDGLYHDRLSEAFISSFKAAPLRSLLRLGLKYPHLSDLFADLANLLDRNYGGLLRSLLAHRIIYQSKYSKEAWSRYCPGKASTIIVNGAPWEGGFNSSSREQALQPIQLVTFYDDWRPSKRIEELIHFIKWGNEEKKISINLNIIGFNRTFPKTTSDLTKRLIDDANYISTTPRFDKLEGDVIDILNKSQAYITFTFRDACPNVVIEAMAHGLPVIATASGGLSDIVGDAGIIINIEDDTTLHFYASRYENDFPHIDYTAVLSAILDVINNNHTYLERLKLRFQQVLDIHVVAEKYREYLIG